MKKCKKCGGILEENANYCILCGEKAEQEVPEQQVQEQQNVQNMEQQNQILNNPSNYPNASEQQVVVPSHANINVNETVVSHTPAFQSMPEVEHNTNYAPPEKQNKIFNVTTTKKPKKKKARGVKAIYIIAAIAATLFIAFITGLLIFLVSNYTKQNPGNPESKLELNSENSYRVGSRDYGYVSVPNSWIQFGIEPDNQTIQYTDAAVGWIVTLYSVGNNTISSKEWADSIIEQMNSVGATDITIKETSINNYKGYKVFGYYESVTTYLAAWILETPDNKIHYVAVEGPNKFDPLYDIIYTFNINN